MPKLTDKTITVKDLVIAKEYLDKLVGDKHPMLIINISAKDKGGSNG